MFLAVAVTTAVVIGPIGAHYAAARTVTTEDIYDQQNIAEEHTKGAVEQYVRLLMYLIIFKLETQVQAQK